MQNETALRTQAEIDSIRLNYEARMNLNQYRRDRMIGWALIAVIVLVPAIAAFLVKTL